MLKGKRVRRKATSKPLAIRNPFRSTSYNRYKLNREFVGPVKGRYGDPLTKLGIDQEKLKKMQKLGMIPDTLGVQMREFTGNSTATSQGVSSLQALSDEQDLARQVEMFNAGILSKKQQKLKSLLEIAKKKKKYDFDKKVVEWLATAKEIEQIPPELMEDVHKYWRNEALKTPGIAGDEGRIGQLIEANMTRVKAAREAYAREKLAEKERKGKLRGFFEQPRFNTLQPSTATSLRYSDNSGLLSTATPPAYTAEERRKIWELHKNDDDMFQRANAFNIYTSGMTPQQRDVELQNYLRSFQPNNSDMQYKFAIALHRLRGNNRPVPPPPLPPRRQLPSPPQRDPITEIYKTVIKDPKKGAELFLDVKVPQSYKDAVIKKLEKLPVEKIKQIRQAFITQGVTLASLGFNNKTHQQEQVQLNNFINSIKDDLAIIRRAPIQTQYQIYQRLGNTLHTQFTPEQLQHIQNELNVANSGAGDRLFMKLNKIQLLNNLAAHPPNIIAGLMNWFYGEFGQKDRNLMNTVVFEPFHSLQEVIKNEIFPGLLPEIKTLYRSYANVSSPTTQQDVPMEDEKVDDDDDLPRPPEKEEPLPVFIQNPSTSVEVTSSDTGSGYLGWRAPRLHRLVRPYKPFMLTETPEDIIEGEKHDLDDRRAMYKDQQLLQRGLTPPKDMVDRAMPKTAKPFLHNPLNIPFTGVIPHPFVFPDKKYFIQPGL